MKYKIRQANTGDVLAIGEGFLEFCEEMEFEKQGWSINSIGWSAKLMNMIVNEPLTFRAYVLVDQNDYPIGCCAGQLMESWLDPLDNICEIRIWFIRKDYRKLLPKKWIELFNHVYIWACENNVSRVASRPLVTSSPSVEKFLDDFGFIKHEFTYYKDIKNGKFKQQCFEGSSSCPEGSDQSTKERSELCQATV